MEFIITYKNMEIDECVGVPKNYSIFELKLCENLTSVQTKNESPRSLGNFLDYKRKNTLKIILHKLN